MSGNPPVLIREAADYLYMKDAKAIDRNYSLSYKLAGQGKNG
jgi:hypothetical protein